MKYCLEQDISQFQDFTIKRFGLTRPRRVWRHLVPDDPPYEPLSVWFTSAVKMQKQQVTEILNESKRCRKSDKNVCSLISDAGNNFLQTFYWWVSRAKIKNCLASFSFHSFLSQLWPKVNLSHCGDKPVNIVSASKYEALFPYLFQFSDSGGGTSCRATASCPGEPGSNPFLAFTKNPIHLFLRSIELFLKHK